MKIKMSVCYEEDLVSSMVFSKILDVNFGPLADPYSSAVAFVIHLTVNSSF